MPIDPVKSVLRRVDDLEPDELLRLHREVCRRAAAIYAPMYQEKRDAHYATGMMAARAKRG